MKATKNLDEDESLDCITRIGQAYPIARQKYEDNAKWQGFQTELNSLCSGIGKDWEDKVDNDEFECNLTDHMLSDEIWNKIAKLFADAIKE